MNSIKYPKITVVTPNFNQGDFIERTILSVLGQNYPNLEYIIVDGGSTDDSVNIIAKYQEKLHYWVSEEDSGMYDAINKGFSKSSGDIMCWINSDDVLWEGSLSYIAEIFMQHSGVLWLQGYPSVIDEAGKLLFQRDPVCSKYHFYNFEYQKDFSFIQQESTFWKRTLWEKSGGKLNTNYNLASDFELWLRFYKYAEMHCTRRQLAAFRKREGQKSANSVAYLSEADIAVNEHLKRTSVIDNLKFKLSKVFGSKDTSKSIKWIENL